MSSYHDVPESELAPHLYSRLRRRCGASSVPSRRRTRCAGRGRTSDPRPGQGRVHDGITARLHRGPVEPAVSLVLRVSASASGRKPGLGEGAVSVSFAAISLAKKIFGDLNRCARSVDRGRRDGRAHGHPPAVTQGVGSDQRGQPDTAARGRTGGDGPGRSGAVGRHHDPADVGRYRRDRDGVLGDADRHPSVTSTPRCVRDATVRCSSWTSGCLVTSSPSSGEIEQVFLYNIDDLQTIVRENLTRRQSKVDRAESIVDEDVEQFYGLVGVSGRHTPLSWRSAGASQTIRQSELDRLKSKAGVAPRRLPKDASRGDHPPAGRETPVRRQRSS